LLNQKPISMSEGDSCNINAKSSCCSSSPTPEENKDYKAHWDTAYTNSPNEKLGWFETDLSPTLQLIEKSGVSKSAKIINIGAGSTMLIDELIKQGFDNLIATDISPVSLSSLENRIGEGEVEMIVDDLTKPTTLKNIDTVDLWVDRAVLHFFTEEKDQKTYFELLKSKIKSGGFALIAEYNLDGATKCAGLDVYRYNTQMIADELGSEFKLIENFNFTYTMPHGDLRPYVYTLFQKN